MLFCEEYDVDPELILNEWIAPKDGSRRNIIPNSWKNNGSGEYQNGLLPRMATRRGGPNAERMTKKLPWHGVKDTGKRTWYGAKKYDYSALKQRGIGRLYPRKTARFGKTNEETIHEKDDVTINDFGDGTEKKVALQRRLRDWNK